MIEEQHATEEKVPLKTAVGNLKDSAEDIIDTYSKLAIATATKKGADAAAGAVSGILMAFIGMLTLVFAFIGLAFWIGTLVNSTAGGFLIVAGFFALLLVLIIVTKGRLITPLVRNTIVKKVYEQRNNATHNHV
jgi:hypothetical protein